jgi:tetratricopeptide (TPR) repeat protein
MIGPGVQLSGRYRLDERIAGGGMGDVWRGTDEVLGRTVAVKILLPALLDEPGFAERFRGEARTMANINHPGVVDVYDYGTDDDTAYLVMEYVEGDALATTLARVGRLTPARTMALVAQAADALHAAHEKGIVHRDVKPGNLLVRPNGTLVLTDFGIARSALVGQLTAAGSVLGTASYISPEQAVGEPATAASDRYALAVVAFELLTGERPFKAEHFAAQARAHVEDEPPLATERDPSLPRGVDGVLDRGMAKAPGDRWESATAMVAALDRAMGSSRPATEQTRVIAPPPDAGPPRGERAGGGSGPWLLAGLAGLLLIAVLGFLLLSGGDGGRSDGGRTAEREPTATATATATAERTPEATREATPEPTQEATAEPTATSTPGATGGPDLDRAADLQVQGFNARRAGNYEQALALSQQALEACGDAQQLSPCGYALFEVGAALNALGRPDEAIPYLEQRLEEYGDNSSGEVKRELKAAEKAAKKD